jgi:ATP-dependent DNA helicase RecG
VTNPGGLFGITVERLGHDAVTSARNLRLVQICQYVRSLDTGGRVIEALASGIPTIATALASAGLPPAQYVDANIRFTVLLRRPIGAPSTAGPSPTELRVYDALGAEPRTVAELEAMLTLAGPNIRKALRGLRSRGLVRQDGGRGHPTVYRQISG